MIKKAPWTESIEAYRDAQKNLHPNKFETDAKIYSWIDQQIAELQAGRAPKTIDLYLKETES